MKYGCVVHSLTDFSKSSSCFCAGSRVSVTICCAGSEMPTARIAAQIQSPQRPFNAVVIGGDCIPGQRRDRYLLESITGWHQAMRPALSITLARTYPSLPVKV